MSSPDWGLRTGGTQPHPGRTCRKKQQKVRNSFLSWEKEGPLRPFNLIFSPQDGAPGNSLLPRRTRPEISPSRGNPQRTRLQSLSTSGPENPFLSHRLTTVPGKSQRGDRKSPQEFPTDSGRLVSRAQTQARRQQGPTSLIRGVQGAHSSASRS